MIFYTVCIEYTNPAHIFQVDTGSICKKNQMNFENDLTICQKRVILVKMNGAVAQLARAIRSHRIGHGFDSHQLHHFIACFASNSTI